MRADSVLLDFTGCSARWQFRRDPKREGPPDFELEAGAGLTFGTGTLTIAPFTPDVDVEGDYYHELWIDHPSYSLPYLEGIWPIGHAVTRP